MAKGNGNGSPVKIVGDEVKLVELLSLQPNTWNPNVMTPFERQALRQGLVEDGWLRSQSMLVWGKDKRGKLRNVIIDGEHRWVEAKALGMPEGPAVLVHGISEQQAKQLTIKLGQKRGHHDPDRLGTLVRSLAEEGIELQALSLGISDDFLAKLLSAPPEPMDLGGVSAGEAGNGLAQQLTSQSNIKMVPLYFDVARHEKFVASIKRLGDARKLETVTDVVEAVVNEAAAKIKSS